MSRYDRLSTLIDRFALRVLPDNAEQSNLVVLQCATELQPCSILISTLDALSPQLYQNQTPLFCARIEWGGADNPLLTTLPHLIEINLEDAPEMSMLVQLLKAESEAQRCGVSGALNRLGEVLMIRILRYLIERGQSATGLLGGLADQRLSKAIVSIHEAPGRCWKNDDLAAIAGLSMSRFAELFRQRVGETPQSYLRRWRMILARQDIQRGERVQQVANRYGYGSSEALGRAFQRQFGHNPLAARLQAAPPE